MSKDTKGALIVIGVAIIITVGIFFITRGRGKKEEVEVGTKEENIVEEEFVNVLSDGTKLNTSDKLQVAKTYDGMEFKDFQLTEKGNKTTLLGTITNKTSVEKGGYLVDLKLVDKGGKELETPSVYIKKLQPGESMQLSSFVQGDGANAYDFTITKTEL